MARRRTIATATAFLVAVPAAVAAPQLGTAEDLTSTIPSPRLVDPVDLDGDGADDVLVTDGRGTSLYRVTNLYGPDQRIELVARVPGGDVVRWRLADLDADGDVDAVAIDGTQGRLYAFERTAEGFDTPPRRLAGPRGTVVGLDVADFDGDGHLDVLIATDSTAVPQRGVFALHGRAGLDFHAPRRLTPSSQSGADVVTGPIRAVDLDRDSDLDLLIHDTAAARIVWFRNWGGPITIGPFVAVDGVREVTSFDVGDVDANGRPDLLVLAAVQGAPPRRELRVYPGGTNGTFGLPIVVDASPIVPGGSSAAAILGDADGDGDLDAVHPRRAESDGAPPQLAWFENDGTGLLPGPRVAWTPAGWTGREVRVGDLDGDGVPDLLTAFDGQRVTWSRGFGNQTFDGAFELTRRVEGASAVDALDVDGDGALDLVVGSATTGVLSVLENRRGDGLASPAPLATGLPPIDRVAGRDLDGDGDDDVAFLSFSTGVLATLTNTDGDLGPPVTLHAFGPISGGTLSVVDVDGDGDADVIASAIGTAEILWFEQAGGALRPAARIAVADQPAATGVAVDDVDGDGAPDVVIAAPGFGASVGLYRGLGGGSFAPRAPIATIGATPRNIATGDLDGDGDVDVAVGGGGSFFPVLEWIPQDAPGQFGAAQFVGGAFAGWVDLVAADVDLDGDVDLIGTPTFDPAESFELAVYRAPFGGPPSTVRRDEGVVGLLARDLDGDGDTDVIATSTRGDAVFWLAGTGRVRLGDVGCDGVDHSLGYAARAEAVGAPRVADNAVTLRAYDLPPAVPCLFLTSREAGTVVSPGGSIGTLCLGGTIGRFDGAGQIGAASAAGVFELAIDLTAIPQHSGAVSAVAGDTWHYQAWFRDADGNGGATSNLSGSIVVELR